MPASPFESNLSEQVSVCLKEALPNASINTVYLSSSSSLILILQINQILAAFAFGRNEADYTLQYTGFKEHFRAHGAQSQAAA